MDFLKRVIYLHVLLVPMNQDLEELVTPLAFGAREQNKLDDQNGKKQVLSQ